MKHLFVTDMDGTLLGPDSRVSPESAGIISRLSREGVLITVATARTPATVEPLLRDTFTTIPAIVLTGAAMWDRESATYIDPQLIDPSGIDRLMEAFATYGVSPFVYTLPDAGAGMLTVYHSDRLTRQERNFYEERARLDYKRFEFLPEVTHEAVGTDVALMLGIGPLDRIMALGRELERDGAFSVSAYPDIFNHSIGFIEVFAARVSKAAAILKLKRMTGADRVTAYGDNLNDLPMFAVADEAVAVGNALPEVKSAATRVIGPNSAGSVALDILSMAGL